MEMIQTEKVLKVSASGGSAEVITTRATVRVGPTVFISCVTSYRLVRKVG